VRIGAILPHTLVFGGVRRYIELGNRFIARGHRFSIYTIDGAPPAWLSFDGEVATLGALGDAENDVMLCGSPELLPHLDRAKTRVRIFYLQIEGVDKEESIVRSGRYHVMVNSRGLARRTRRLYRVEPLDGRGGINPALFHPAAERPAGGPFKILCYGRTWRPRKGTRFVVEAVRTLRRRGLDVELQLFDAARDGGRDPRIGFEPGVPWRFYLDLPQERMAAMYGAADVFVSAERRAGWSNTAAEAAACGVPLVCTRSGTEDFAVDGESAIVVPARGSFWLVRALGALARDGELRERMGREAARRMREFTWDALCARMERTFNELLAGV
jgi:glycosyltransferase involved in cell wall biosynthesis